MPVVRRGLLNASGLVLADNIIARINVPQFDNSAMDGFAVKAANTATATQENPAVLTLIGEVSAGSVWRGTLRNGSAVRIMTGAPVPSGSDCVVRFEDTDEEIRRVSNSESLNEISILRRTNPGSNIRRAGEDILSDSTVLPKGHLLRDADIGILASIGISRVPVYRPPSVAIIATGDELIRLGRPLMPGKIYDSNNYSLAALVKSCGAVPVVLGIARDEIKTIEASLLKAMACDLVITSGGVSLGDYDLVKNVLKKNGHIEFWTVRMKPGKPLAFGVIGTTAGHSVPHLGLPGNPVSVMVTFELFAKPAILKMMGRLNPRPCKVKAILQSPVRNNDGRRIYTRVTLTKRGTNLYARLTGDQGSGVLTSMALADGLAIIPENTKIVENGTIVDVIVLNKERLCS
jgi:molybdopterin molybdotransferase